MVGHSRTNTLQAAETDKKAKFGEVLRAGGEFKQNTLRKETRCVQ